jgi:hypothetical protein
MRVEDHISTALSEGWLHSQHRLIRMTTFYYKTTNLGLVLNEVIFLIRLIYFKCGDSVLYKLDFALNLISANKFFDKEAMKKPYKLIHEEFSVL